MPIYKTYTLSEVDLERDANRAFKLTIAALKEKGFLSEEACEELDNWALIIKKPSFFSKILKNDDKEELHYTFVKKVL